MRRMAHSVLLVLYFFFCRQSNRVRLLNPIVWWTMRAMNRLQKCGSRIKLLCEWLKKVHCSRDSLLYKMADALNPFEVNIDGISDIEEPPSEINVQEEVNNDDNLQQNDKKSKNETMDVSWDSIAAKLLRDNYVLTALELYTEFIESGRELPRLRDYFSNPGNFEITKELTPSPPTLRML